MMKLFKGALLKIDGKILDIKALQKDKIKIEVVGNIKSIPTWQLKTMVE